MFCTLKAALLAAALAAHAHGQEDEAQDQYDIPEQAGPTLEQMHSIHGRIDGNNDGKVSMAEVLNYSAEVRKWAAQKDANQMLNGMDADKDGKLSLREHLQDMDEAVEGSEEEKKEHEGYVELETQKFKAADANGDGFLEGEELPGLFFPETHGGVLEVTAKAALAQKDTDGDGMLTMKEFLEGDRAEGEELAISDEDKAEFASLDRDGNERLDLEELKAWESGHIHTEKAMKMLFDLADKDSDMHMTAKELSAAREQIATSHAHNHLMEWAAHSEL